MGGAGRGHCSRLCGCRGARPEVGRNFIPGRDRLIPSNIGCRNDGTTRLRRAWRSWYGLDGAALRTRRGRGLLGRTPVAHRCCLSLRVERQGRKRSSHRTLNGLCPSGTVSLRKSGCGDCLRRGRCGWVRGRRSRHHQRNRILVYILVNIVIRQHRGGDCLLQRGIGAVFPRMRVG